MNAHPFIGLRRFLLSLLFVIFITPPALWITPDEGWAGLTLEAALCDNIDLIRGSYNTIERLTAGADGFSVAVTNGRQGTTLVHAQWEALETEHYLPGQSMATKTIFLGGRETGFISFQAPASGLLPGIYRIRFSAEGQGETDFPFAVVKAAGTDAKSSVQAEKKDAMAGSKEETVTEALDRVFETTEGPETAAAGIEVITRFFDSSMDSASGGKRAAAESDSRSGTPVQSAARVPEAASPKKSPARHVSSRGDSIPETDIGHTVVDDSGIRAQSVGPLKIAMATRVDSARAPLETPKEFTETDERIYLAMQSNDPTIKDLVKVRFLAEAVEGAVSGTVLADSDVVLQVNGWRTAIFLPPYGGFWPGTYRAVVEQNGTRLAQVTFRVNSPVPPAILLREAPPVEGINIAQKGLGGKVVSATSEANRGAWAKEGAADGYGYGGEDCKPTCGWASSDRKFPQELVFSFFEERQATLKGVILNTESCSGDEKCIQSLPRLVDILVSETAADGNFSLAATCRLRPVVGRHFIPLPGIEAKAVKLAIRSNYGGVRRTQLAEFEVLEDSNGPSIVDDLQVDLLLPALDGNVTRFSSQRYGHEAWRIAREENDGKNWRSADSTLPQEFTFCFRGDQEALIDSVEIDQGKDSDGSSKAAEMAVELSSISPLEGFREVARIKIRQDEGRRKIPIDLKAKFVKLRLLANHGGAYTSLGKVRIVEGREPGYVTILQRPFSPDDEQHFTRQNHPQTVDDAAEAQPGLTKEDARELSFGKRIRAGFTEAEQRHYYRLHLEGRSPGMLNIELTGAPFPRTRLTLKNEAGDVVADFVPKRNHRFQTTVSWQPEPGTYLLEARSIPANLVLAWDVSGSMSEHTDRLQQAVTGFIEKVRPSEKLNLIAFNNEVKVLLEAFTNDKEKLLAAVSGKFKAEMATRLYDAVEKGAALLEGEDAAGAMVVMTDGVDMGSTVKIPDFWKHLENSPVRLFTVGLGGEVKVRDPGSGLSGQHLLRHIAEATGGGYRYAPGLEQLADIYRQIAEELMAETTYSMLPSWNTGKGTLLVESQGEAVVRMTAPPQIELVMDCSGSMKEMLGSVTRMETAKQVLADLIRKLPDEVEVALRVYGHRIREGAMGDCQDSELVIPFDKLDRESLLFEVNKINPLGTTPIAYALEQVAQDFGSAPGEKTVILVTDGKEECRGDLTGTVKKLRARGLDVRLHIVGFTIQDEQIRKQMRQAASAGDGEYFQAEDREGLKQALDRTLAMPFTVHDTLGNEMASGSVGQELSLLAGSYFLKFDTLQGRLSDQQIKIVEGRKTRIRLTQDGPEIGIQVLPSAE